MNLVRNVIPTDSDLFVRAAQLTISVSAQWALPSNKLMMHAEAGGTAHHCIPTEMNKQDG
jgi:hypothetical protein